MNEFILIGLQSFVFIFYILYIYKNFKILPSISDSWYHLNKSKKLFFTLFCWCLSLSMMLYNIDLLFLSGIGFAITGVAGPFNLKITRWIHNISALSAVFFALYYLYKSNIFYIPLLWMFLTLLLFFILKKNKIWWIEITSFLLILSGLFISFM